MCQASEEENLKELISPIAEFFHGIIVVVHDASLDDLGIKYLESVKGEGEIIQRKFVYRHDVSMNEALFCGKIQNGDLVCYCDSLERIAPRFASVIGTEVDDFMKQVGADVLFFFGKPLVFRYNEYMKYVGSPHWGLSGASKGFELNQIYKNEKDVRLNVRPIKRTDPFNWVSHYLRYYVAYPAGSNVVLLGLDTYGDPQTLFPPRETNRLVFREELRKRGVGLTVDDVVVHWKAGLDNAMKDYINSDIVLNNAYRYFVRGDKTVVHSHDPKYIVKID